MEAWTVCHSVGTCIYQLSGTLLRGVSTNPLQSTSFFYPLRFNVFISGVATWCRFPRYPLSPRHSRCDSLSFLDIPATSFAVKRMTPLRQITVLHLRFSNVVVSSHLHGRESYSLIVERADQALFDWNIRRVAVQPTSFFSIPHSFMANSLSFLTEKSSSNRPRYFAKRV